MRTAEQAKTDVAGIVGRWQVDDLHAGHKALIDEVRSQHRKVLIFVGVSDVLGSIENPLDYPTCAAMISAHYPDVVVLPIRDRICDKAWSKDLDHLIRLAAPIGEITLYGGRDSFTQHYVGKFRTIELDALRYPSGTDIREEVGREVRASSDFRAGVIYSTFNQYPRLMMVVDVAALHGDRILLARKEGELTVRFPGGFVDAADGSLEAAARRECQEETGVFPESLDYLGSFPIPDGRMGARDAMLSAFFLGHVMQGGQIKTSEELQDAAWVPVQELRQLKWYPNHAPLFEALCKKLGV